jgi:hypothetical protein
MGQIVECRRLIHDAAVDFGDPLVLAPFGVDGGPAHHEPVVALDDLDATEAQVWECDPVGQLDSRRNAI